MAAKSSIKSVEIYPDAFQIGGRRHALSEVQSLRLVRRTLSTHTAVAVDFTKIGQEEHIGLLLTLKSGEQFQFTEQPGWIKSADQNLVQKVLDFYNYLAEPTFDQRANGYIENFQKYGYFYYSGFRFNLDQKTISDDSSTYDLNGTEFLRGYGYLELRPKNLSFIQQAKLKLGSANFPRIDTLTDTDAFFAILATYYSLRWQ